MDERYITVQQELQKNYHVAANDIIVMLEDDERCLTSYHNTPHERFSNTALLSSVAVSLELKRWLLFHLPKSILSADFCHDGITYVVS
jgi:hypothetical protein